MYVAGAGQDVGRSCILVSIGGKNIMLDCGMHMGYNDDVGCSLKQHNTTFHVLFSFPDYQFNSVSCCC